MKAKKYNRNGYIWIIVLFIILLPFFIPRVTQLKTFSVVSGSMEPDIPTGSLVYVKDVSKEELKENDVITFYGRQGSIVTHRIQSIESDGIVTKGDANEDVDLAKVRESQIIGKVILSIPLLGYFMQPIMFYIVLLLLLVMAIYFWWKAYKEEKEIKKVEV